ncbi:hypothetical protein LCGC14_2080340 [marine sediment metagenome]|uniref:Uncharacterized protein n=1 Tax=marine sediment metagenome TaxID=412755 RepID=A0A0F9HCR7_9ZZZZ
MCFFHRWSKWEKYDEEGIQLIGILAAKENRGKCFHYVETRQKRTCEKCGRQQDIRVQTD